MRVRIVEDDASVADWLKFVLEDADMHFYLSNDFQALLTKPPWGGIDAALIDYHLGGSVTGLDVLRYLYGEFPRVRRVLLTAHSEIPPQAVDLAHAVLQKPVSSSEIIDALKGP